MVTLQLRQLDVPPGHRVMFKDVSWQEFEAILAELGDHRAARLAYSKGTLEIRMPLPEHEVDNFFIDDMVKILLEELEIDRECFGLKHVQAARHGAGSRAGSVVLHSKLFPDDWQTAD